MNLMISDWHSSPLPDYKLAISVGKAELKENWKCILCVVTLQILVIMIPWLRQEVIKIISFVQPAHSIPNMLTRKRRKALRQTAAGSHKIKGREVMESVYYYYKLRGYYGTFLKPNKALGLLNFICKLTMTSRSSILRHQRTILQTIRTDCPLRA